MIQTDWRIEIGSISNKSPLDTADLDTTFFTNGTKCEYFLPSEIGKLNGSTNTEPKFPLLYLDNVHNLLSLLLSITWFIY